MVRLIRALDDLLEALIFDVAFGTPRRRRLAMGLASIGAVALYWVSGLLFVPAVPPVPEVIDSAPYFVGAASQPHSDLLRQVAADREIPAGREAAVERELAGRAGHLDRLVSLLAASRPAAFAHTPDYRDVRAAADALLARGVWLAGRHLSDAAVLQWITALRLARVVASGPVGRPARVLDGLVASDIERETFQALTWHRRRGMSAPEWAFTKRELAERRASVKTLRDYMMGDRAAALRFFHEAHERGGFAEHELGIYLSRALMPLKHADRAAFMDEVRDRYLRVFDADIAMTTGNTTRAVWHTLPTDYALLLAPFSREHSVTRMANLLLTSLPRNYAAAGARLEQTEQAARELEKMPPPRLAALR